MHKSNVYKELVSIVVPVYNSVATLDDLYDGIEDAIDKNLYNFEVIFVDDYSTPVVWSKLKEIASRHQETVQIIRLSKNFGQNNATLCGLEQAGGEWIVTIDDDLEFDPKYIHNLIQTIKTSHADVVYAGFKGKRKNSIRSLGRSILFFLLKKAEGGTHVGSSYRIIHRNIVESICKHSQDHIFINQLISWYTNDVEHIEIERNETVQKNSGYSLPALVKMGFKLIFYYTSLPIKLVIYFSFLTALVCLGFVIFYTIQKITVGTLQGYTSLIVAVFAATTVVMASIGVLAVFVNRIYNTRIRRPNYSVKRKL